MMKALFFAAVLLITHTWAVFAGVLIELYSRGPHYYSLLLLGHGVTGVLVVLALIDQGRRLFGKGSR